MSCFDTVLFKCPECFAIISKQSKDGECNLKEYSSDGVPIIIAAGINNKVVECDNCEKEFIIDSNLAEFTFVSLRKRRY